MSGHYILDPAKFNLNPKEVEFETDEKIKIKAWLFETKNPKPKGNIVFFHGNGENISTHFLNFSWILEESYNYLIFDYPSYGFSEGEATPKTCVSSGKAAIQWVHTKYPNLPLIVYGQSLGGNIAFRSVLDILGEVKPNLLVIDSSFLSYRSMARQKASESWLLWLLQPVAWLIMSDQYAPKKIDQLSPIPLLVIHGDQDTVVPFKNGEEIFSLSKDPKEFWIIPEGQHTDIFWAHKKIYRKKFVDYLAQFAKAK